MYEKLKPGTSSGGPGRVGAPTKRNSDVACFVHASAYKSLVGQELRGKKRWIGERKMTKVAQLKEIENFFVIGDKMH